MIQRFMKSHVCNPWPGARSFLQVYNPANSGVLVRVPRIVLGWSMVGNSITASGFDLRAFNGAMGTFAFKMLNKRFGGPDSQAEIRFGNCLANELPSNSLIAMEPWTGPQFVTQPFHFDDRSQKEKFVKELGDETGCIELMPGWGAAACAAHDNTYLIGTVHASEEPLPA